MRDELGRGQALVIEGQAEASRWTMRILAVSGALTLSWWVFGLDGAAAGLLSLMSLGLGVYAIVLVGQRQAEKAAGVTRTEQRLAELPLREATALTRCQQPLPASARYVTARAMKSQEHQGRRCSPSHCSRRPVADSPAPAT